MAMTCPHGCGTTFEDTRERAGLELLATIDETDQTWMAESWRCPSCGGATIDLVLGEKGPTETFNAFSSNIEIRREDLRLRAWPRSVWIAPAEVPQSIAADFTEAGAVLDISPRAAGVLARRCLQQVLVDHLGANPKSNLKDQIDAVAPQIPGHLVHSLHGIREVGNFGAHPGKDQHSGDLIDVEPGEIEWTLTALQGLFDHVFVEPGRQAARLAAVNRKLQAAGRNPVPTPAGVAPSAAPAAAPPRRQEPPPIPAPPPPGVPGGPRSS